MGCNNSTDDAAEDSQRDYDAIADGMNIRRRVSCLDFSSQGLVSLPGIPKPQGTKILILANNFLTRLPKDMKEWTSLEEVVLASNRFVRIPDGLSTLPNLLTLDASNNPIARVGGFDVLATLTKLKKLTLSLVAMKQLPSHLSRCRELTYLDVGYNQQIDLVAGDVLKALPMLQSLHVPYCSLRGPLPSSLAECARLTHLNLSGNTAIDFSELRWGKLQFSLTSLSLGSCGLRAVPKCVLELQRLTELNLGGNQSLHSVVGLETMSSLTTLSLADCGMRSLPLGLECCSNIKRLEFGGNEPETFVPITTKLALESLSLSGSQWATSNDGDDALWSEISEMKSLKEIEWQVWGEKGTRFSVSPYTTRFPLPLCALRVKIMNGIAVRQELFQHDDPVDTLLTVINDGYYKVDLGFEFSAITSHLNLFDRHLAFSARSADIQQAMPNPTGGFTAFNTGSGTFPNPSSPATQNPFQVSSLVSSFPTSGDSPAEGQSPPAAPLSSPAPITVPYFHDILKLRYALYLYLQATITPSVVLIPPVDVSLVHYTHMLTSPSRYMEDVERVLQGINNANVLQLFKTKYRKIDLSSQQESSPKTNSTGSTPSRVIESPEAMSTRIWNDWVMSHCPVAQRTTTRIWLSYQFLVDGTPPEGSSGLESSVSGFAGVPSDELYAGLPAPSLAGICRFSWGSTGAEVPIRLKLREAITDYLGFAGVLARCRHQYESLSNECLERYIKFLVLTAKLKREAGAKQRLPYPEGEGTTNPTGSSGALPGFIGSPLVAGTEGPASGEGRKPPAESHSSRREDGATIFAAPPQPLVVELGESPAEVSLSSESDTGTPRHSVMFPSAKVATADWLHPVPTLGIQLAASLHRSTPEKYIRDLRFLGLTIEDTAWHQSVEAMRETQRAWEETYQEPLLTNSDFKGRRQSTFPNLPARVQKNSSSPKRTNLGNASGLTADAAGGNGTDGPTNKAKAVSFSTENGAPGAGTGITSTNGVNGGGANSESPTNAQQKAKRRVTITTLQSDLEVRPVTNFK